MATPFLRRYDEIDAIDRADDGSLWEHNAGELLSSRLVCETASLIRTMIDPSPFLHPLRLGGPNAFGAKQRPVTLSCCLSLSYTHAVKTCLAGRQVICRDLAELRRKVATYRAKHSPSVPPNLAGVSSSATSAAHSD